MGREAAATPVLSSSPCRYQHELPYSPTVGRDRDPHRVSLLPPVAAAPLSFLQAGHRGMAKLPSPILTGLGQRAADGGLVLLGGEAHGLLGHHSKRHRSLLSSCVAQPMKSTEQKKRYLGACAYKSRLCTNCARTVHGGPPVAAQSPALIRLGILTTAGTATGSSRSGWFWLDFSFSKRRQGKDNSY